MIMALARFKSAAVLLGLTTGAAVLFLYFVQITDMGDLRSTSTVQSSSGVVTARISPSSQPYALSTLTARLEELDCQRFFASDQRYIIGYKAKRVVLQREPVELDMACPTIKTRWGGFGRERAPQAAEREREFTLAFARTVFKDYLLLEHMLSVEYEPWNYYCYSLDAKASLPFKERIRQLASCFPNVLVAEREYAVYSNGKNVTRSHLACLERLLERGADWRYAILLQNYDIPHKTNAEKVEILHLYQGANDIATKKVMPISVAKGQNWTLAALKLYRNDSRNREMARNANGSLREVYLTKSLNLVSLSRKAVEFVVRELDVNTFIDTLEASPYGMDEDFYSTLNTNLPDFPGGFTTSCLRDHNQQVANMGRYVLWQRNARCMSRKFRHDICVFGAEDLAQLAREQSIAPVYLNKMMPIFDFGTSYCWLKRLAERRLGGEVNINASLYQDQPHVRYHIARLNGKKLGSNALSFACPT